MKMTNREKFFVAALLSAIIIYFEFTYLVSAQMTRIAGASEIKKNMELRLDLLENAEKTNAELDTKIEENMTAVNVVMDKYFIDTEQEKIILLMNDLLDGTGVDATGFTFKEPEDIVVGDKTFRRTALAINFKSMYPSFEGLLKKIWDFNKMIVVDNVAIAKVGDGFVEGNLELGFYYLSGHEGTGYKDDLYLLTPDDSFFKADPFSASAGAADFRINYAFTGGKNPGKTAYVPYTDIKGHWAEADINSFGEKGYLPQSQTTTFTPDAPMTRGEFIIMLDSIYKWPVPEKAVDLKQFSDYAALGSYENSIAKAVYKGFISGVVVGYADNTIRPRDPLTYEEMEFIIQKLKSQPDFKWDSIAAALKTEKGLDSQGMANKKTGMTKAETVFLMSKVM